MDDGVDAHRPTSSRRNKRLIADIALDELGRIGHRPAEAGRQIVEHDHILAGVEQLEHHMAADEARPARDQNSSCDQP